MVSHLIELIIVLLLRIKRVLQVLENQTAKFKQVQVRQAEQQVGQVQVTVKAQTAVLVHQKVLTRQEALPIQETRTLSQESRQVLLGFFYCSCKRSGSFP